MNPACPRGTSTWLGTFFVALLVGCASDRRIGEPVELSPAEGRALISKLLPPNIADRTGWATDIYAAFAVLEIAPTPENICAVVAVTEQESSFRIDPPVPGLAAIAWKEIDNQAERVGIPPFVVRAALRLSSPNGKSYSERIDAVKTERELSEIFEDFIGMVPLGKTFFADRNPVRTGGPMQVSIWFAEAHAAEKNYPYPVPDTIRYECSLGAAACTLVLPICSITRPPTTSICTGSPTSMPGTMRAAMRRSRMPSVLRPACR